MRVAMALLLAAFEAGCAATVADHETAPEATLASATADESMARRAPVAPFTPPTPAGCAGAADYDGCFAFTGATPLEVVARLPESTRAGAAVVVRFHRLGAEPTSRVLVADHVQFRVKERRDLRLYFQVFPGLYQIEIGVDVDGDGDPDGAADARGWSSASDAEPVREREHAASVEVGGEPVSTSLALALPQ